MNRFCNISIIKSFLLLLFITVVNGSNYTYLEHFNTNGLSDDFKNFNLSACSVDVGKCWRYVHDLAEECVAKYGSKPGTKLALCNQRGDMINFEKQFEALSSNWHGSLDKCFRDLNFTVYLASVTADNVVPTVDRWFRRRKRQFVDDNASEQFDDEEEENNPDNYNRNAKRCWKMLARKKVACRELSMQCPVFANCLVPSENGTETDNYYKWAKLIKQQCQKVQLKKAEHKQKMLNCISSQTERY